MPDNGQSRHIEGQPAGPHNAAASSLAWRPDRISQAETFGDLTLAVAGSLGVALLANLLALCF